MTDRNKILKIRAHFHSEAYRSKLQDRHSSQKNTSPDASEIKKSLKEMKNNRVPDIDNLTNDVMIF